MISKKLKNLFLNKHIIICVIIAIIGCTDDGLSVPPDIPVDELLAANDTILVDGREIYLATYLWYDFMPSTSPDGRPLNGIVYVTATDTLPLPNSISSDVVWMVYKEQVWKGWLENDPSGVSESRQYRIGAMDDSPKWGPHIYIDVIVRVHDGKGNHQLLRATRQLIGRTD